MARLIWDDTGDRVYETGIDQAVLYPMDAVGAYPTGYAWNGLIGANETPEGAEKTPLYADNTKYLELVSAETLKLTLEAYTFPDEFAECDGAVEMGSTGAMIQQQARKKFGLCYRTKIGNDVAGDALGYKYHLVYGCLASPSEKAYQTINDSPEAITFSWEVSTTPVGVTGKSPTSLVVIDSTKADPVKLAALLDTLYGDETLTASLPLPDAVITALT